MARLRMFAAALSVLSLLVAALLRLRSIGPEVLAAIVVAAACLAIVAPFDAPDPPSRKRVLLACLAYVGAMGVAVALALRPYADRMPALWLAALAGAGVLLSAWAFKTRNRRRSGGLSRYYDE